MWSKFHVSTQYILFHGRYLDFWNNIVSSWRAFFSWTPEPKINHFGMILILVLGFLKMIIWIMWVSSTVTKQKRSRTPWPCFTVFLGSLDATLRTTGVDHDICLFLKNLFVFTSLCPTFFFLPSVSAAMLYIVRLVHFFNLPKLSKHCPEAVWMCECPWAAHRVVFSSGRSSSSAFLLSHTEAAPRGPWLCGWVLRSELRSAFFGLSAF